MRVRKGEVRGSGYDSPGRILDKEKLETTERLLCRKTPAKKMRSKLTKDISRDSEDSPRDIGTLT